MSSKSLFAGKFQMVRRIGVGGMAEVYEAKLRGAEGFHKRVAVKVLLPELRQDPQIVDMFIDEATIVARLTHPNIVHVFDFGEAEDSYYLAMEFVDGITLRQLQRRLEQRGDDFPVELAAYCAHEVCRALEYIHGSDQPVVHRDVTPHNIFVTRDGQVKLGDFGIAKTEARRSRTASGQIKGKLAYLAPEQVTEERVTAQTDVYAVGLVLFELLTGRPVIGARREVDMLREVMSPRIVAPSSLRPEAAPLDRTVLHALEKHPAVRCPTARLLADALEAFLASRQVAPEQALAALVGPETPPEPTTPLSTEVTLPMQAGSLPLPFLETPSEASRSPGTRALSPEEQHRVELGQSSGPRAVPVASLSAPGRPGRWIALLVLVAALTAGLVYALSRRPDGASRRRSIARAALEDAGPTRLATPVSAGTPSASAAARSASDAAAPRAVSPSDPEAGAASPAAAARHARARVARRARRSARRRADAGSSPTVAARASTPTASWMASAEQRRKLAQLISRARAAGVFAQDDAQLDRRVDDARSALRTGPGERVNAALAALENQVDGLRVDRDFARRKLARLHRTIGASALDAAGRQRMERISQEILHLMMAGRLATASRKMSQALVALRSLARTR